MKLSLVVPCFNEQDNVQLFHDVCKEAFKNIESYEIIYVNDGSHDNTWAKLKEMYKNETGT